jgi:hypothetical protein
MIRATIGTTPKRFAQEGIRKNSTRRTAPRGNFQLSEDASQVYKCPLPFLTTLTNHT